MREIKFRGKRVNGGEWVKSMTISYGTIKRKMSKIFFEINPGKWVGIIPNTIGQFTGLKDKSEKEIYEGDIISVNGKYPKLIRYIDEWASYCLANLTDLDCDLKTRYWHQVSPCWWTDYKREIKVIGNVYDNPELLKGGNHESNV